MYLLRITFILITLCAGAVNLFAQDLHFSQYYNAPLLQSPANTALMPVNDFRMGANFRTQWANIPAPYQTYSVYGDFQLFRNRNLKNWMGVGFGFFNDKAGNGNLQMNQGMVTLAYHALLNDYHMISGGIGASFVQRSVDFSKLSFDTQWNGFFFDKERSTGEVNMNPTSTYADLNAGLNYAYLPNDAFYIKFGVGLLHVNQPKVSLLGRDDNRLSWRPTATIDALIQIADGWIANPSVYYTQQQKSMELIAGSLFSYNMTPNQHQATQFILGVYHRFLESAIVVTGLEWNHMKLLAAYDITVSPLISANGGNGAFELSLTYQGLYGQVSKNRNSYNCPRF